MGAHAPHRQAAEAVAGTRPAPRDGRHLSGEDDEGEGGGHPARDCQGVDEHGDGDEGEPGQCTCRSSAGRPRRRRAGEPAGGELPGDRPGDRPGEGNRPHPLADRTKQHLAPRDWGEHQVPSIACFQRDRPAVTSAAHTNGDGGDGDQADHCGSPLDDVGELARRHRFVRDQVTEPHHGETSEQGGEIHPVGDLEPFQLAEATGPPGPPHLAQGGRRRRHSGWGR